MTRFSGIPALGTAVRGFVRRLFGSFLLLWSVLSQIFATTPQFRTVLDFPRPNGVRKQSGQLGSRKEKVAKKGVPFGPGSPGGPVGIVENQENIKKFQQYSKAVGGRPARGLRKSFKILARASKILQIPCPGSSGAGLPDRAGSRSWLAAGSRAAWPQKSRFRRPSVSPGHSGAGTP